MINKIDDEIFSKLTGKKWRNLNEGDYHMIPTSEHLADNLQKFVMVCGENFERDSKENSSEFQTEDLIADPKETKNLSINSEALMLILILDEGKNYILLTEKVDEADVWVKNLEANVTITIRHAFHKVKVE